MKYLVKISLWVFIYCCFNNCNAQTRREIKENSILGCIQGVWQPINSQNEDIIEYVIYDSFKSLSISYTAHGKLERIMITINGFKKIEDGHSLNNTLNVNELDSDGNIFVWFFEEDIDSKGEFEIGGVQTDFICEGDIIEMSDNAMTILEKQSFLPYTAYSHLKEKAKQDNRNYLSEFNLLKKMKKVKVKVDKAYFHNNLDCETKRKEFVLKDDELIVDKINNEWIKLAYEGKNKTTIGWFPLSEVEIID